MIFSAPAADQDIHVHQETVVLDPHHAAVA
jgi:hypothetical protein